MAARKPGIAKRGPRSSKVVPIKEREARALGAMMSNALRVAADDRNISNALPRPGPYDAHTSRADSGWVPVDPVRHTHIVYSNGTVWSDLNLPEPPQSLRQRFANWLESRIIPRLRRA